MMQSEDKDEMEEMEKYLQGDATHNTKRGELGLGIADEKVQDDATQFGFKRREKKTQIVMKEDELLQDPTVLKADYDLMRVQMRSDLYRLQSQLKSVFKA
eukprot:CAMPEP_0173394906 /NCGR_PEP_ID=MMETSP1356-20130122/29933_1 /TAXON_ID=77927 ORGANISM="Hemiselmis virescens, Strain PCC157" /NCGR_SAMPLE_ID=MMETSP1356 /ASSEMBLY_ACC=CAM_ASM_000847 /LENGTH=99 /DNA_ID=CAMNT_0014353469 /DNA_START=14 /DNA_END=313 /DNA_ORIENTATION=-